MTEKTATVIPKVVLVKFQFTNKNLIPAGIRKIKRNKKQLEEKREENNITAGEHTEGENVNVRPFVAQLFKTGYFLSNAHYYAKGNGHNAKYTLVLAFNKNKPLAKLPKKAKPKISKLTEKDAWGFCHFWRNPNGVWTVNLLRRIPSDQTNIDIGELFFEAPDDNPKKYIHEKI